MTNVKKTKAWKVILERELKSYFTSWVPYFVCMLFLLFVGSFFLPGFYLRRSANLRGFFQQLPLAFSLFIPPLTMKSFSEEKRSGSLETLVTLPVTTMDVVLGKYLAAMISCITLLVPTLFYLLTCCIFGNPDAGPLIGGYIGAILMAAAFCSIGMFASSVTKNQIAALFTGLAICMFLYIVGAFAQLLPAGIVPFVRFISATSHFESISRGVIDSRDVIYFLSLIAVFFGLTVKTLEKARRG